MIEEIETFYVVGISIASTNENGQSIKDMGKLWGRFYSEKISDKVSNKASKDIYSVFTDYESDYTGRYKAIIGHKVHSLENIPDGLASVQISEGKYQQFVAKGKMPDAIVATWKEIWQKDDELNRAYTADFEVYSDKSNNGENPEVDIFVAVK